MSVHRTCWTEKVKCCPCLDLPAPANGTSRVCGPHGPRITCAGDVAAGRQVFYSLVVHIAHFINEARGMQPSGMFQMFPRVHKTRPQYFLHLYGLRAGCTDYTLSLKKKKKRERRKPRMVPNVGHSPLSSQTNLLGLGKTTLPVKCQKQHRSLW